MHNAPTPHPASRSLRSELRAELRRKLVDRQVHCVVFVKRDGTRRTMRLKYEGGTIRGAMMQVRDLDKDAVRTVNLSTVELHWTITPKAGEPQPTPQEALDLVKREMDTLFC